MKRVTGIGGIFFKCEDPEKAKEWYNKHLGIASDKYGAMFEWRKAGNPEEKGCTVWGPFEEKSDYFAPSQKPFMLNYRVENLEKLLDVLKDEGVEIVGEMQTFDYGKFGWIMDPEGNKIELWEPLDSELTGTSMDQD